MSEDLPPTSTTGLEYIQGRNGHYKFAKPITRGTYGRVEKWFEMKSGGADHTPVAIKFIKLGAQHCKYPIREVVWLSRFHHPHIIKFYELIHVGEHLGIVMEYMEKGTFRDFLNAHPDKKLSEDLARWYFQQLIVIVDFCHRVQGVAHRDLKPDNLLLNNRERPRMKLGDFGMSKHISWDSAFVTDAGTRDYKAPELKRGVPYDATKSDIWSCGVLLHETIYGSQPNYADEAFKARIKVSAECQDLMQKMLTENPTDRIDLEGIKASPWFTKNLHPEALALNDKFRKFSSHAQDEEEICNILRQAFPETDVEQISRSEGFLSRMSRLLGGPSPSKRVRA